MTNRRTKYAFDVVRGSVYVSLGYKDADEMLIKAQLVSKIAEIIERRGSTQPDAAKLLGLTQPKSSGNNHVFSRSTSAHLMALERFTIVLAG